MHRVLSAFARAAAGDPHALDEAREAWAELAAEQQTLLASLGKLLAAAHERSAALPEVLDALAARDLDRARREFRGLASEERELIGAIGRYLADRGERTLPLLGAFDGVGEGGPVEPAGHPGWAATSNGGTTAGGTERICPGGMRSKLTPEDLLVKLGLSEFRPAQRDAVQAALDARDTLVEMPTGGGKSLSYQLPAIASESL